MTKAAVSWSHLLNNSLIFVQCMYIYESHFIAVFFEAAFYHFQLQPLAVVYFFKKSTATLLIIKVANVRHFIEKGIM